MDLDGISTLLWESEHAFSPPADTSTATVYDLVSQIQSDPSFEVYGYVIHGKPISYIMALGHTSLDTISIGPMFVSGEHRAQGLGTRQVAQFIAGAREAAYVSVFTKTWESNEIVRHIFDKLGFVRQETLLNDRANGDTTIAYLLNL